jgi:hypothetical protein
LSRLLRDHLTYANVMATLAVFIALGGSSYAAIRISGSQLKNRSVSGKKIKRNTLGGATIRESRLGTVPSARRAARVGGLSAAQLRLHCPAGTRFVADACVEETVRLPAQPYGSAALACLGDLRRLATYEEVNGIVAFRDIDLRSPPGELTGTVVSPSSADPIRVQALVVTNEAGAVTVVPNTNAGSRPFRCALDPAN